MKPIIILICCFAFIATSLPKHIEDIAEKSEFITDVCTEFQTVKEVLHIYDRNSGYPNYYPIEIPEKRAHIVTYINVDSINESTTRISLDSIVSFKVEGDAFFVGGGIDEDDVTFIKNLTKMEIEQLFFEQIKRQFEEK